MIYSYDYNVVTFLVLPGEVKPYRQVNCGLAVTYAAS